jgi:hypothetical protein
MNLITDEATRFVRSTDVVLRLQRLVAGWHGAERGQPLTTLHSLLTFGKGVSGECCRRRRT